MGSAYSPWQYWDGRKDSQWSQALSPLEDPDEHGGNRMYYARFISEDPEYRRVYESLFGSLSHFNDKKRFPIVTLLKDKICQNSGPIILNASNEILVDRFIKKKIPYSAIYQSLRRIFKDRDFVKYAVKKTPSLDEIYKIDKWARKKTLDIINKNL